jgi:hypothetical protein
MYRELENISDPFPLNKSQPLKQTTLISTFQKKTQLNSYWIKAVKGAGLGRVFVMTLQGFRAVKGWVFFVGIAEGMAFKGRLFIKKWFSKNYFLNFYVFVCH